MPAFTTPTRPTQQIITPSRPQRLQNHLPSQSSRDLRPQDIIARRDLLTIILEEVRFAQEKIVARIDYVLNELKTETNPERRQQGWAVIRRLQRDDLADCNAKIEAHREELRMRNRALGQYEREFRDDVRKGGPSS